MITVVGLRLGTLAQILPAAGDGIATSPRPSLYAAILVVVTVESLALCWFAIRTRGFFSNKWAAADVLLATALLLAQPLYVTGDKFIGSWTAWAPGFASNAVVVAALGFTLRRQIAVAAIILGGSYVFISLPHAETTTQVVTVRSNGISYLLFAIIGRTMGGFIRRFGDDADEARAAAIEAARIAELQRHRRMLHDQASLLKLLSDPDIDAKLDEPLRQQALNESNRLRHFLGSSANSPALGRTAPGELNGLVLDAVNHFPDLPTSLAVDLGAGVRIDPNAADAIRSAIETALFNIRLHAGEVESVVIHTDVLPSGDYWELTIRDDGNGFDTESTSQGFGISRVLGSELAKVGVRGQVDSAPGMGTVVTIKGPVHGK